LESRRTLELPALLRYRATKSANIRLTPCQTPINDVYDVAKKPIRKNFAVAAPYSFSRMSPSWMSPLSPLAMATWEECRSSAPTKSIAITKMPVVT